MIPTLTHVPRPLWLLLCALPPLVAATARGEEPPPAVILTDTEEYCDHLQHLIGDRAAHVTEAHRLFVEGRRMCDHGEVRAGIARLRQALILVRHHPTATAVLNK
jgi:hypothetical protein